MSILVNKNTRVLIQGITGTQASFHVRRSVDYGTNVVAGVTPGKGGISYMDIPVFNTVSEAVKETQANASVMFVPAKAVKSALKDAVDAGLELVACIADGVPIKGMTEIRHILSGTPTTFIGPNTPGIITPGEARLGIFPENILQKGKVGIISRSSTLTYEAVLETNRAHQGQSTVIGLGDDMVIGMDFIPPLEMFMNDSETEAVVIIGQLDGAFEEMCAKYYADLSYKKPVISFVAGNAIPFGHKMGYAGDVIAQGKVTAEDKKDAMKQAGMIVVDDINDIHKKLLDIFNGND